MTGRSLHDALLLVLSNGTLRARLIQRGPCPDGRFSAEWEMLGRVSCERLRRLSRFLARHYYRERIVRLFRHVRSLAPHTGRDPLALLEAHEALTVLDHAVLGSAASAESLLALIEPFLLDHDCAIMTIIPYWTDLVRYQAAMFRVEAGGTMTDHCGAPRRSPSARIIDLDWNLPAVLAGFRTSLPSIPQAEPKRTTLLIARSRNGQVTTVRCAGEIRLLLEAANGERDVHELAAVGGLPSQQAERLLRQMEEIGAIGWNPNQ